MAAATRLHVCSSTTLVYYYINISEKREVLNGVDASNYFRDHLAEVHKSNDIDLDSLEKLLRNIEPLSEENKIYLNKEFFLRAIKHTRTRHPDPHIFSSNSFSPSARPLLPSSHKSTALPSPKPKQKTFSWVHTWQ